MHCGTTVASKINAFLHLNGFLTVKVDVGFSSHSWRLALETMKTQGKTQGGCLLIEQVMTTYAFRIIFISEMHILS